MFFSKPNRLINYILCDMVWFIIYDIDYYDEYGIEFNECINLFMNIDYLLLFLDIY